MKYNSLKLVVFALFSCNVTIAQKITTKTTPAAVQNINTAKLIKFTGGKCIIKSAAGGRAIDIDKGTINAASPKIQLWDACADYKVNCEPQIMMISAVPNTSNQYTIQLVVNGKYLTVNPLKKDELAMVAKLGRTPSPFQTWTIESSGNGKYTIKATAPTETKALTISANANGSGLRMELANNSDNQNFTFYNIAERPQFCFAEPMPPKPIPPASCVNCEIGISTENLVANTSKMWTPGSTLRVRLDGATPTIRRRVIQFANEWTTYANIRFNFIQSGDAEIIVTFGDDGASHSYVGKDAIEPGRRFWGNFTQGGTMHFGWLTDDLDDSRFRRVVLHEFGHALGFEHEQSHPDAGIPWNREAVYAALGGPPNNWDRATVDRNVFEVSNRNETQFSSYDRTSIMQYAVDESMTIGNFSIGLNTDLSAADKAFAKLMYPPGNITGNKLVITVGTGGDDIRQNSNALIFLRLNNAVLPEFRKSLNNNVSWGNNSTNTVEIGLPDGVNLTDILEAKILFTSGKQFETDSPDNWNLNRLRIDFVTADGFRSTLVSRLGNPFLRFSNTGELRVFNR